MCRQVRPAICALGLVAFLASAPLSRLNAQQKRVLAPVDTGRTVALRGNVHPNAQARYDRGLVDPAQKITGITILLKPSESQRAELSQFLSELQDPASPNYHKWLTPEQYADRFGASDADLLEIGAWLEGQGLSQDHVARGRNWMVFSGTAGQVQSAFRTGIHRYVVNGETHFANSGEPSIPAALEPVIQGIQGLDDFRPKPLSEPDRPAAISPSFTNSAGNHRLAPGDIATIYGIAAIYNSGYTGSGQKIVVIGQSNIHLSDVQAFRSQFGLPQNDPKVMLVPNAPDPGFSQGDMTEANLDLDWTGAIAPDATILYVYSTSALTAALYAIDQNLAPVVSYSFGSCERQRASLLASFRLLTQQANTQGITWVASSGDTGGAACDSTDAAVAANGLDVLFPASIPEVTAVGGTRFNEGSGQYWNATNGSDGGSARSYIPEVAWNDSSLFGIVATGGGVSKVYPKPAWQTGPGVPQDGFRDVPDIAFAASPSHDPYYAWDNGALTPIGGTSASAPVFAGIVALLNQYASSIHPSLLPGLGNINPILYWAAQNVPAAFHDILAGNNVVRCTVGTPDCLSGTFGYLAGPGYDMATGLGSVDAYALFTHLYNSTSIDLTANPPQILASGATLLTATVTAVPGLTPSGFIKFSSGGTVLGTVALSPAGIASLAVNGSALGIGSGPISAVYAESLGFLGSSATTTVSVTTPGVWTSHVVPSSGPNPVYQQPADSGGFSWFYTLKLSEVAGVATTVTSLVIDGTDSSTMIQTFFKSATLPAHGSLSALISDKGAPRTRTYAFGGVDAGGAQWSRQISVPYLASQSGSMAQIASAGTWDTSLTLVNLGSKPAQSTLSFFADQSGIPLSLPFSFPQDSSSQPVHSATVDQAVNPQAVRILDTTGPPGQAVDVAWAKLVTTGDVNGFAIFSIPVPRWQAVVPLETRTASSYLLAFDNTGPLSTGLAIANLSAQPTNVPVIIRDDKGTQILNSAIALSAQGHTYFMLNATYGITAGKRGTVEFLTPPGGQISVLGLRSNGAALTTLPVLANVDATRGSMSHVAYHGGFTTVFTLVNSGDTAAPATLSFFGEDGAPLSVPISLPQSGTFVTDNTLTRTLAAGATLVVETQAQDSLPTVVGSAQLTTTGNVSGFGIFRWTTFGQEASVPLETRAAGAYVLVFDNTSGLATGLALANVSSQAANIQLTLRDDSGALIETPTISLAGQGHTSFMLAQSFPATAGKRGTVEFATPPGGQISALGLRAPVAGGLITTIPVFAK